MTKITSYGIDETISAAARILALESDATHKKCFILFLKKRMKLLPFWRENVFCRMFRFEVFHQIL
jgi:hypothetical protein